MTVDGKVVPQVVVAKARKEALTSLRAFRVARSIAHGESWASSSLVSRVARPDDIDAEAVHLHGFRVTDPSGEEQAARDAVYEQAWRTMGPPRRFRTGPDGTMQEISLDSP